MIVLLPLEYAIVLLPLTEMVSIISRFVSATNIRQDLHSGSAAPAVEPRVVAAAGSMSAAAVVLMESRKVLQDTKTMPLGVGC